jgi:hypothetical protein
MGVTVGNVYPRTHGQAAGPVTDDREIRFHKANASIDETLDGDTLGNTWKDLVVSVRDVDATAFAAAIVDLKAMVGFTWSTDWTDAVHEAFKDMTRPA